VKLNEVVRLKSLKASVNKRILICIIKNHDIGYSKIPDKVSVCWRFLPASKKAGFFSPKILYFQIFFLLLQRLNIIKKVTDVAGSVRLFLCLFQNCKFYGCILAGSSNARKSFLIDLSQGNTAVLFLNA